MYYKLYVVIIWLILLSQFLLQDFSVTLFLHQEWIDYRLKFKNSYVKRLQLDPKDMDRIWTPDTYFVQAKNGYKHDITKANTFLHVYANGTVLYSIRSVSGYFS